jgi:methanogenic corrinoid protein MtbC1
MPDVWDSSVVKWTSGAGTIEVGGSPQRAGSGLQWAESRSSTNLPKLVTTQVVPRIVMTRSRAAEKPAAAKIVTAFSLRDIAKFAKLTLRPDSRPMAVFVERAVAKGLPLEEIYLQLLQPTARYLGTQWELDVYDFATVTLGMCQLHLLVRDFGPSFQSSLKRQQAVRHALLTTSEGEQHSFGLAMVGEFLRRDGWIVTSGPFTSKNGLGTALRSEAFALVGFSLSCDKGLDRLAGQIRTVRQCSPNAWVMVGGRVFLDRPDLVARIGADATGSDARQAAVVSRRLATMLAASHA